MNNKIYSVSSLNENSENLSKIQIAYIDLKSKQRELSRLNSKIFKYNRYYNSQTELFARFCELYFLKNDKVHKLAPNLSLLFSEKLKASQIKQLNFLEDLM